MLKAIESIQTFGNDASEAQAQAGIRSLAILYVYLEALSRTVNAEAWQGLRVERLKESFRCFLLATCGESAKKSVGKEYFGLTGLSYTLTDGKPQSASVTADKMSAAILRLFRADCMAVDALETLKAATTPTVRTAFDKFSDTGMANDTLHALKYGALVSIIRGHAKANNLAPLPTAKATESAHPLESMIRFALLEDDTAFLDALETYARKWRAQRTAQAEAEAKAKAEAEAKAKAKAEAEAEAEAKAKAEAKRQAQAEAKAEAKRQAQAEAQAKRQAKRQAHDVASGKRENTLLASETRAKIERAKQAKRISA